MKIPKNKSIIGFDYLSVQLGISIIIKSSKSVVNM